MVMRLEALLLRRDSSRLSSYGAIYRGLFSTLLHDRTSFENPLANTFSTWVPPEAPSPLGEEGCMSATGDLQDLPRGHEGGLSFC